MIDTIAIVIIAVGVLFDISGCIGLVRLPDLYNRIQASSKCVTVGTSMILIGSVILLGSMAAAIKGLLCIVFVLVTSATAAHALARAAYHSGVVPTPETAPDRYREDRRNSVGDEESSS